MTTNREQREMAIYVAWQSHLGVRLQISRLREAVNAEPDFGGRHLADTLGVVTALWRLRLSAHLSQRIDGPSTSVDVALQDFDVVAAGLTTLRHVAMHFDEYVLETDKRRNKIGDPPRLVTTEDLWKFELDFKGVEWLGVRLNFDAVELAARQLYDAIQEVNNSQRG